MKRPSDRGMKRVAKITEPQAVATVRPPGGAVAGRVAATALLNAVFPQHCVACGGPAPGPIPVCACCSSTLQPLGGSRCAVCGVPLVSEHELCLRCRSRQLHYDCHRSVFAYSGVAKQLIVAYKFGARLRLAALFSDYLVALIPAKAVVVPVPASPRGRRRRGYDQVTRLAGELRRRHGISVLEALRRTRGREQKRLDFDGRSQNLVGAVKIGRDVSGARGDNRARLGFGRFGRTPTLPRHVVLLDDVFTTGATVNECARVLRSAGVVRIDAVTLAAD